MHAPTRPAIRMALAGWVMAALLPGRSPSADDGRPAPGIATAPARLLNGQPVEEYARRRRDLMARIKPADAASTFLRDAIRAAEGHGEATADPATVVVLLGRGIPGDDDKFHQEPNFAYLTGVDQEDAALILWPATGEETLYLPPKNPSQERWNGPRLAPGPDASARTGFARVESSALFLADLFRAVADPRAGLHARAGTVHLIEPDPQPGSTAASARFARFLREGAPNARFIDVAPRINEMRKVKSEPEVALIRQAIAATATAQDDVARLVAPGVTEARLEGAILAAFFAGGGSRAAFPSIVGSGINSTVLHYNRNDRTITEGDLVVVDIGSEVHGYAADITRTYPASGIFTFRQREVYQLVLDAQTGAAAQFKPGETTLATQSRWVKDFLRKSPLRARDETGTEQSMDHFFTHGLGHYMGLEVHDVGDSSKPLAPGEVFTIEPGLYIPSEGFGVRIEDDYLVTKDGLEKLSRDIPSDPAEVERRIANHRVSVTHPPR